MAHLPKEIVALCTPFLIDYAFENYGNVGYSFKLFDISVYDKPSISTQEGYGEQNYLCDELHKYHWFFTSFDSFKHKHYVELQKRIKVFNQIQDRCKLHLTSETGGHIRRICGSDSDNYGTYYFLIYATYPDNTLFTYTIPKTCLDELKENENVKYSKKHKLWQYEPDCQEITINYKIITDDEYSSNNHNIARYISSFVKIKEYDIYIKDDKRNKDEWYVSHMENSYKDASDTQKELSNIEFNLDLDIAKKINKQIIKPNQLEIIKEIIDLDPTSKEFLDKWKELKELRK